MTENNNTNQSTKEKKIVKILKNGAAWIGITFIVVGIVFGLVTSKMPNNEPLWIIILKTLMSICSTGGATFLSVALIDFIYEQWHDQEMEKRIRDIPELVKENINASITQISENVVGKISPGVPSMIFPPGHQENDPIAEYLKKSITNSDGKYYYTGIEMSTMAKAINELTDKLKEAYFLIPNPSNKRLTDDDRNNMVNSIETMIKVWESAKQIKLEFIFLHDIPPFHIHKTSKDCWFAFLDMRTKDNQQRQKYPATYQYKKNKDKSDDNYEMYHTISDTIEKLYERHRNGADSDIYIFKQRQEIKASKRKTAFTDITCQKGGKPMISFTKENFIKLFTNPENHE